LGPSVNVQTDSLVFTAETTLSVRPRTRIAVGMGILRIALSLDHVLVIVPVMALSSLLGAGTH